MLFEILTMILAIYACLTPIIVLKSVQFGIKCAEKPEKASESEIFHLPKKKKKPEVSDDVRRELDVLANIDIYDGTSQGQKEIK